MKVNSTFGRYGTANIMMLLWDMEMIIPSWSLSLVDHTFRHVKFNFPTISTRKLNSEFKLRIPPTL